MAAKQLLLLVAFAVTLPTSGVEQESQMHQWQALMKAFKQVQGPQDLLVLKNVAAVDEDALEQAALKDAEKEISGLETMPAEKPKVEVAQHLRASTPSTTSDPTTAALKIAVTDMMAGKTDLEAIAAFAATPFGDSVQKNYQPHPKGDVPQGD